MGHTVCQLPESQHIGSLAGDPKAPYKKLAPTEENPEPDRRDSRERDSSKHPRGSLHREEEMHGDH